MKRVYELAKEIENFDKVSVELEDVLDFDFFVLFFLVLLFEFGLFVHPPCLEQQPGPHEVHVLLIVPSLHIILACTYTGTNKTNINNTFLIFFIL